MGTKFEYGNSSYDPYTSYNNIAMKQYYRSLYNRIAEPIKKILRMLKGRNDDDFPFDHPWAIF